MTSNCYKNKSDILENNTAIKEAKDEEIMSNDYLVSNMNDDKSIAFVKKSIKKNLNKKNKDYTDPEVCPPFIMENDKYVEI